MSLKSRVAAFGWAGLRKAVAVSGVTLGALLLCLPLSLFSQSYGRILGSVTDQTGGVIAGATVTVTDTDRNVSRTLTTDDAGEYNAPNLSPGKYTVRAEAKGFKVVERQNIILEVGKEPRVDLTLQPGEQTQTLTVTEAIPLVETTNATLGGTLNNTDIVDLPLNGRDYQNLMGLRPGVMLLPGGGPWTQSTNGVRPDESVWMVEGIFNANPFDARPIINMPSPFTDAATILPVDAIQEFNLMENPKAEYGWKAGAVVNVGVRSGTNTLHGSAYAFGRDQSWDARNFYNIGLNGSGQCQVGGGTPVLTVCDQTPAQLKQFGGVVGGPIKKDKLFFFAGYEGLRSFIGSSVTASTPATGSLGGNPANSMVDAIQALQALGTPRSKVSEQLLGCTEPTATTATCSGGLFAIATPGGTTSLSPFANTNTSDNGIAKIDYHINSKNTLNGMFFLGNYNAIGEDHAFTATPFTDTVPIRTWTDTASWVFTPNSTMVNEARFGYNRVSFNFVNVDVNTRADGKGYALNTGVVDPLVGGLPNVAIGSFMSLGTASNRPQYFTPNPTYDFIDSVSYLKGKHAFKFGGEFAHMEADNTIYVNGRGTFNFNGGGIPGLPCPPTGSASSCPLEDFFAGTPSAASLLAGKPALQLHWMTTAGFIQDDWRITPKVTINLGLRYEYFTPMKAANDLWGGFDPTLGMVQQGKQIQSVWKGDHRDFAPRFGFAWDVTGKGTTVVRGGASIVYSSYTGTDFMGAFGLDNDVSTSPAAVPTAAQITCNLALNAGKCPATGGGTIGLGGVNFTPGQLCWDAPPVGSGTGCSQATAFPSPTAKCGDGVGGAPSPCDIMGVDPNLRQPYIVNFSLGVQHQIGSNLSVDISYVGNHGYRLLNFHDINQAPVGAGYCLNATPTAAQLAGPCAGGALTAGNASLQAMQTARPFYTKFPYLGFINFVNNGSHSQYNSLQATVTKRMSHGLLFNLGYTYGHGLDNGSLNRFGNVPQDSTNLNGEYASSDFDIRHRVTFTATYNIPGKQGYGQILEGWQINAIVNYQTPQPWLVEDGIGPVPQTGLNFSGTYEDADRWNISGPATSFRSGKASIPFVNVGAGTSTVVTPYGNVTTPATAAQIAGCTGAAADPNTLGIGGCFASQDGKAFLTPPALGHYGNMGRNIFRDSGYQNLDMSIFKNFKFRERFGAQFRWEVFNVFNHPIAANPYGSSSFIDSGNQLQGGPGLGFAGATPDFIAGNPLVGSGSQRVMQLGLKLTF